MDVLIAFLGILFGYGLAMLGIMAGRKQVNTSGDLIKLVNAIGQAVIETLPVKENKTEDSKK